MVQLALHARIQGRSTDWWEPAGRERKTLAKTAGGCLTVERMGDAGVGEKREEERKTNNNDLQLWLLSSLPHPLLGIASKTLGL